MPKYLICSRCKRQFSDMMVKPCKHPGVVKTFGENICYYCCKHCKHHVSYEHIGAIACGYKKEGDTHV